MPVIHATLKAIKNLILPKGDHFRRLPIGPLRGSVMKIDFYHQFRQYLGLYEFELNPHFKRLVRPGMRSFDIGGKGGYSSLLLSSLSQGGQVLCFECDPPAIEELKEVVARNRWPIRLVAAFVGDRVDDSHKTIDWAAQEHFVPDFIKLDIEGAEVLALKGADRVLRERKPSLIIETHGLELEQECLRILRSYGYDPKVILPSKVFPEKRETFAHNQWIVAEGRASAE